MLNLRPIMLVRSFSFHKSILLSSFYSSFCRRSHKPAQLLKNNHILNQQKSSQKTLRFISSNAKSSSKNLPIILGVAGVGSVIAVYTLYFKGKSSSVTKISDDDDVQFIHEHLEEDLALIKEFGPVPYLLIGAGNASFAAYRAIRARDPTAKIVIIGEEAYFPYLRPPLSKEMWFDNKSDVCDSLSFTRWDGSSRSIFYEPPDYFFSVKDMLEHKNGGVSVIRGKRVTKIDPVSQKVYLDKGEEVSYAKCLIATGAKPKNLPIFENADASIKKHVSLFRNIRDFKKLFKICNKAESIVVVGGGFLGSELACGMAKRGETTSVKITQVFPESGNLGKILPEYLSKYTTTKMTAANVNVIPDTTVSSVSKEGNKIFLSLSNGEKLKADHVVVAVGAEPNTELALNSGLEIDNHNGGFLVNTEMGARKNLWIAGDASCFYDPVLGRRRVEHHDHAIVSGKLAGENMAGDSKPYWYQSMLWSDLGPDIGFEAIGLVDSELPTVGIFAKKPAPKSEDAPLNSGNGVLKPDDSIKKPEKVSFVAPVEGNDYSKGVVFYLRSDVVVGIVLWNVFAKMSIARKIIDESKAFDDLSEVAKLFDLHSISNE